MNRLSHFLGVTSTYAVALIGFITLNFYYVLISPFLFLLSSFIGHKLIEGNEMISSNDRQYGSWPAIAAFTFTHRVYMGKENILRNEKIINPL